MTILIVDDDVPFLETIKNKIEWKKLGIHTVFTAHTVADAKEKILAQPIDILMTDIEMPVQSGLDLIRWIQENDLGCVSIILSSFPDFNYAQKAVSYGVFEYLLKTANKTILEDVIFRAAERICTQKNSQTAEKSSYKNPKIVKIQDYIRTHISENITRDDVADYVGFSPEYLSAYFKKEAGCTLTDYINSEKLSFAQQLLVQTDLPISMIAQNIGFDSASYFTMLFRKTTGYTPREFRKQHRGI